jgi:maltose alpha-D-glucosyltransferase/alpha-amylase
MQLYGRGIRRRLAPMLGNDGRRLRMAYALQCALPGTPVIRYGEEIGMGDAPESDGRRASRAAMQWDGSERAGFSTAPVGQWWRPLITDEQFGHRAVNVADQQRDPSSLLSWFRRLLAQREAIAPLGRPRVVDDTPDAVLALEYRDAFIAHNLSGQRVSVAVPGGRPWRNEYGIDVRGATVTLPAYGSAWLVATRAREEPSRPEPGARVGAA